MLRRSLVILLVTLHAATPALAGACAMHCAADLSMAAVSDDCHGAGAPQGIDPDPTDDGDGSTPATSLMQAACAVAATAAVVPSFLDAAAATTNHRIASATPSSESRSTQPPHQPPRA